MTTISIVSLNVNGIKNYKRRQEYFEIFKMNAYDVVALQETFIDDDETVSKAMKEWPGESYWCKGHDQNKGVAILLRERSRIKVTKESKDKAGRVIMIDVRVNDDELRIVNVYYPVDKSKADEMTDNLYKYLDTAKPIVLLGDFNFVCNYELDRIDNRENDEQAFKKRVYTFTRPCRVFNKFLEVFKV